ncbi:hypothetical protein ACOMCU_15980 [Lysinibacillus sp. UGB7]|uniref:hypothetical protein n=1 Tax=Lysinibacillus sp. UGB7 TaxID=3411039 RepID=UPI003B797C3E
MSKRRTTKYEHGDRYQVYINRTVDDELLSFINKQSDISGASMLGLIVLYQLYGMTDIDDLLPRNYRVNAQVPNFNINIPNSIPFQQASVSKAQVLTAIEENVKVENIERVEAESTRSIVRPSLSDKEKLDNDIKITNENTPSPVQNEESTKNIETIPDSKGKGLDSINTSSMMHFGKMSKPKKDN